MRKIVFLFISLILLLSSINLTEQLQTSAIYLLYVLLIILLIFLPFINEIKVNMPLFFLIYLFWVFCSISALINHDFRSILSSSMIFILLLVSYVIVPRLGFGLKGIIVAFIISHIPLLILSLFIHGTSQAPYQGIFYNPNSFGTVMATLFAVLIGILLRKCEDLVTGSVFKADLLKILLTFLITVLVFYFIVLSASRTSFFAALLSIVVGFIYLIIFIVKQKQLKELIIRGGLILVAVSTIFIAISNSTTFIDSIVNNIVEKFDTRASQSGILASRDSVWSQTLKDAGLFGGGNDFFSNIGLGAHNTLISILGQYGWLALIAFILLLGMFFYYAAKLSLSNTASKYKYQPIMIIVVFIAMSMGEDMTFKVSMIIMFLISGTIIAKKEKIVLKSIPVMKKFEV